VSWSFFQAIAPAVMSVSIQPGRIALAWMSCLPSSTASERTIAITPALLAA
jgi:hypothetical protein